MPHAQPANYDETRIAVGTDGSGGLITYRPGQFLASDDDDHTRVADAVRSWATQPGRDDPDRDPMFGLEFHDQPIWGDWFLFEIDASVDVLALVRGLRARGVPAQPNHVYFATTIGAQGSQFSPNMFAPNMFAPNMFAPNMFAPNMFAPNMFAPNMFAPNMFAGGGGGAEGCCCPNGPLATDELAVPRLAARPASDPGAVTVVDGVHVEIHVIDIANPGSLHDSNHATGELAGKSAVLATSIDSNKDGFADPALCHGAFVASIIERGSGLTATLWEAADPLGDIDDVSLTKALETVRLRADPKKAHVLNLSLSGYNEDDRPGEILAKQIRAMIAAGWVIVAAAGNNASCRLAWPAALPGVVAVGALSDCAPAWFSNFGPWVDVSAPGVDIVGRFEVAPGVDEVLSKIEVAEVRDENDVVTTLTVDEFSTGWATWSGTSFSAPFVTAKIAKAIEDDPKLDGEQAVKQVVEDPARDWVPYYGRLLR